MKLKNLFYVLALSFGLIFSTSGFAANFTFNVAKGKANELHDRVVTNDPANSGIVVVLLKASEADATLEDYDDLSALLAAAGNTEADFTNYARKVLTDAELSASTIDDTANSRSSDMPDQVWTSAGGTLDNTLVKALICYDPDTTTGTDADLIPLTSADFAATTNGNNLTGVISASGYFTAN